MSRSLSGQISSRRRPPLEVLLNLTLQQPAICSEHLRSWRASRRPPPIFTLPQYAVVVKRVRPRRLPAAPTEQVGYQAPDLQIAAQPSSIVSHDKDALQEMLALLVPTQSPQIAW